MERHSEKRLLAAAREVDAAVRGEEAARRRYQNAMAYRMQCRAIFEKMLDDNLADAVANRKGIYQR